MHKEMGFTHKNKKSSFLWISQALVCLFLFVLLTELTLTIYIRDKALVTSFRVSGDSPFQLNYILDLLHLNRQAYVMKNLDLEAMKIRLENEPQVESAFVKYVFPDTLQFELIRAEPIGAILYQKTDEESIPFVFDKNGILFLEGSEVEDWNIPIVSGDIEVTKFQRGLELPSILQPLVYTLANLKKNNRAIYNLISELEIEITGDFSFETTVYLSNMDIPLRFERNIDDVLLEEALIANQFLKEQGLYVSELDLRSGRVAYKEEGH